jgi:hypothetical protein
MPEIDSIARPISEAERLLLSAELQRIERRLRSFPRRAVSAGFVLCGVFCALTVLATKEHQLVAIVFWLALFLVISVWVCLSQRPKYLAELNRLDDALCRNEVRETRIQSDAFVELEEIEDEGACFAFQLSGNQIVFVSGQDYYPSALFPNNDFSVIRVFDSRKTLVQEFIEKHGSKLKAKRSIPAETKSKLKVPEHLQVIVGDVDELESLLAHEV